MPIWELAKRKWRSASVTTQTQTRMSWKVLKCAGKVDDNDQIEEQGGTTAVNMEHSANSNEQDRREEGMSEILGTSMGHETRDKGNLEMFGMNSDSGDKISKKHGPIDIDMEVLDTGWEDDNYPSLILKDQDNMADSNLKRNNEVPSLGAEHVEIPTRDGPRDFKNRST